MGTTGGPRYCIYTIFQHLVLKKAGANTNWKPTGEKGSLLDHRKQVGTTSAAAPLAAPGAAAPEAAAAGRAAADRAWPRPAWRLALAAEVKSTLPVKHTVVITGGSTKKLLKSKDPFIYPSFEQVAQVVYPNIHTVDGCEIHFAPL